MTSVSAKFPPLFDYYVETDLDNLLDDQLVDYSKKYADQDYEVSRRQSKPTNKTLQYPSQTANSQSKQTCSDEVKVYCFEGTPVAISSASSFCDLRDVGTANLEANETESMTESSDKPPFPESHVDESLKGDYENKQLDVELEDVKSTSNQTKEKDDLNMKEGKSVTFRNEDNISKASSPLMFSRSSSVCSLNSFEQHSIVDDRSSVSAFSTLASGIISPSDLPDSPGEGMSPDSHKARSLKNDISKDVSDNESDNVLELNVKDDLLNQDSVEKKDLQIPVVHGIPWPELSASKLNEQELAKSDDDSDVDDNDILVQQCIKLGMPANLPKSETTSKVFPTAGYEPESIIKNGKRCDSVKSDEDSDGDENVLVQRCIQLGMPKKRSKVDVKSQVFANSQYQAQLVGMDARKSFRDNCPDGVSDDDDDDELLAQCIIAGMPSPKIVSDVQKKQSISSNQTVNHKSQENNSFITETKNEYGKKYYPTHLPQNPVYAPVHNGATWITNSSFIEVDSMRIYRTEDTPILSPSASLSDLSSLSFSEDKNCHEGYLNNSRNSDCSSESEDDELLLQCIRSGMPGAKRAVA